LDYWRLTLKKALFITLTIIGLFGYVSGIITLSSGSLFGLVGLVLGFICLGIGILGLFYG